jgi:hypothetical protein
MGVVAVRSPMLRTGKDIENTPPISMDRESGKGRECSWESPVKGPERTVRPVNFYGKYAI